MAGFAGFRQAYLNADTLQTQTASSAFDAFSHYDARRLRYDLFWSFYQNNTFWDLVHNWSPGFKTQFSLYKYTRHIFNPVHRLGEFWATNIVGGTDDDDAGDGEEIRSAIPIKTKNERLRPAIAKLWRDSDWAINKDVWARTGAVLGDVGLKIVDDPIRKEVTLRVVHPGHVKWVDRDDKGRVRGYILEEMRYDPRHIQLKNLSPLNDPRSLERIVQYNEECFVDGADVVYRTYLNGGPFNWRGLDADGQELPPEGRVPYAFVPLVMTQHLAIGLPFGLAEPHALISKVLEVDDTASNLGDYIRRILNGPYAISGIKSASADISVTGNEPTTGNPQPGRTERPVVCLPENAKVQHLLQELDVPGVSAHIKSLNEEIERDYPELQMDIWATGDPSGRALRVARQRTEKKVQARRTGYDMGLVLGQRMAMAIGGIRGYEGYAGLGADDPFDPKLDHSIGHRPVFQPDPLDDIEEGTAFWTMVNQAVQAGMPLEIVLEREGWDPADIAKVTAQKDANAAKAMDNIKAKQKLAMADTGPGVDE